MLKKQLSYNNLPTINLNLSKNQKIKFGAQFSKK